MEPFHRGTSADFVTTTGGLFVYPLWRGGVKTALDRFDRVQHTPERFGVCAILPGQLLELEEMDKLEDAGLLVLQVPTSMEGRWQDSLAAFVHEQIKCVHEQSAKSDVEPTHLTSAELDAEEEQAALLDEQALLDAINDLNADEGSI